MTQTDEFFQKPKEKILKYGEMCQLPCISEYYRENTVRESRAADPPLPLDLYQPINIRMTQAKLATADALKAYVHKTELVRKSMKDKVSTMFVAWERRKGKCSTCHTFDRSSTFLNEPT